MDVENTENTSNASATAPAYYLSASFDPQRATVAELKTILSKHRVALPTGRVLKEEYVAQFAALAASLALKAPRVVLGDICNAAVAAEEESVCNEASKDSEDKQLRDEEDNEKEKEEDEKEEERQRVGELVARFEAEAEADTDAGHSVAAAIASAVNDRRRRLVAFGHGLRSSFGFARRTVFDPIPMPSTRPEKLRRSGPPPLPAPPLNPQQHLRQHQKDAHRPDFVVPVVPPTFVSQTGLSPPPTLVDRKNRRRNSKNGATPSPTSLRGAANSHANKTSPLGLRSTGPRRVPTGTTPLREQVIVTRTPPFKPHDRSIISAAKRAVVDLNDEEEKEHEFGSMGNSSSAAPITPTTPSTTTTTVDAEFKRKYNLQDFEEDESDDEDNELFRRQTSPKRRKSLAVGENDEEISALLFDGKFLPKLSPREFMVENGNLNTTNSPGKYNLRSRNSMVTNTASASFPLLSKALKNKAHQVETEVEKSALLKESESDAINGTTEEAQDEDEEIEIIFKPHAVRKVASVFGSIFAVALLLPFLFAVVSWYMEVGSHIEYCREGQNQMWIPPVWGSTHGIAKDYWGQVFPSCVACPMNGVCEGESVVSCVDPAMDVFGEEGFGPLTQYIGLGAMCLGLEDMAVHQGSTQSHVNPRIRGRPLPVSKRIEFWRNSSVERFQAANIRLLEVYDHVSSGAASEGAMEIVEVIRKGFLKTVSEAWSFLKQRLQM
ncbi:hypothetical protein BDR26DRAFT_872319 [Obelidium mucronatum]|nr:hypothetical protein BDR26DRAFT_872319 [Obelidium mucronatum]